MLTGRVQRQPWETLPGKIKTYLCNLWIC